MAEPFLAEIRMVGFNFPPRGWAQCDGQILPINQNQSLYSLLGTMYGGDGRTSFALPDMRGRTPLHVGGGINQGEKSGEESHTLTVAEIPPHNHQVRGSSSTGSSTSGAGNLMGVTGGGRRPFTPYGPLGAATAELNPAQIGQGGGNQAHNNMQPYMTLNFVIALQGLFPPRN